MSRNISFSNISYWYHLNHKLPEMPKKNSAQSFFDAEINKFNRLIDETSKRRSFEGMYVYIKTADRILKAERFRVAKNICEKLGYKMTPRKEVSDWKYRTRNKIKVNGLSFVLMPLTPQEGMRK